jgi:hypothetical protein
MTRNEEDGVKESESGLPQIDDPDLDKADLEYLHSKVSLPLGNLSADEQEELLSIIGEYGTEKDACKEELLTFYERIGKDVEWPQLEEDISRFREVGELPDTLQKMEDELPALSRESKVELLADAVFQTFTVKGMWETIKESEAVDSFRVWQLLEPCPLCEKHCGNEYPEENVDKVPPYHIGCYCAVRVEKDMIPNRFD